jgi:hypothetical protein
MFINIVFDIKGNSCGQKQYIKVKQLAIVTIDTLSVFFSLFFQHKYLHHACQVPAPLFLLKSIQNLASFAAL